jgi:excisionase family DNA binding protein
MKTPIPPNYLSTAQVAEALGVGVSTVKRWVEEGLLPAAKTAGGHRKLLMADVLDVARRNNLPVRDLARLTGAPVGRRQPDLKAVSKDLYQALRAGDADSARALVHGAYRQGVPMEELADAVVRPAMSQIGIDWATRVIDVMHEHRASQVCASVLFELKESLERRGRLVRPLAVGGAPEGDFSVLPSLMAQMVMLDCGWDAVDLGPNTPLSSLGLAAVELRPRLVWLSISHGLEHKHFIADYRALYRKCEASGVALVVGGQALVDSIRSKLPYTAHGDSLAHLAAFAKSLYPRPPRRGRGRPPRSATR